MSGANQPPVSVTESTEDKLKDSVSATPSLQDLHESIPNHVLERSSSQKRLAADVLVIDWDGPDDPLNPKKYVVLPE